MMHIGSRTVGAMGLMFACLSWVVGCQSSGGSPPGEAVTAADAWPALKASYLASSRREHDHRLTAWEPVARWDFNDGRMPETFSVFEGQWRVEDGRLVAADGEPERNRTLGIAPCQWPAFRMTFDARLTPRPGQPADRIGDLGIRFNADPQTASFAKGYVAILAHYANQAAVIYRLNVPFVRTEFTPIKPGQTHRIMLEVVRPHIRVWVDDQVVLEGWERAGTRHRDHSDFLQMDPEKIIAIHTWDTRLEIDNLVISVPQKDDR